MNVVKLSRYIIPLCLRKLEFYELTLLSVFATLHSVMVEWIVQVVVFVSLSMTALNPKSSIALPIPILHTWNILLTLLKSSPHHLLFSLQSFFALSDLPLMSYLRLPWTTLSLPTSILSSPVTSIPIYWYHPLIILTRLASFNPSAFI